LGHVVNVVDIPVGARLLEPFPDQVLARALDHPATDRLPRIEPLAVVEAFPMRKPLDPKPLEILPKTKKHARDRDVKNQNQERILA
jgi:hypothetical protein